LPLSKIAELLDVNRTSFYYTQREPLSIEIDIKHAIDKMHTDYPTWGSRQLSRQLKNQGFDVGRQKTRRYMLEMGIDAIYPKLNLSKRNLENKVYPYLLRNMVINRRNQVWSIDITYIRLKRGFIYLTAIIDWYSRCVVAWELDDTLETAMVKRAVEKALCVSQPEIINSDQGSQFTSNDYIELLKKNKILISMDGKGRWADNIIIERWFRSLKYEEVYLKDYENIKEARKNIGAYIHSYNFVRLHSSLDYKSPGEVYYPALLLAEAHRPDFYTYSVI
jgi:putative transposase